MEPQACVLTWMPVGAEAGWCELPPLLMLAASMPRPTGQVRHVPAASPWPSVCRKSCEKNPQRDRKGEYITNRGRTVKRQGKQQDKKSCTMLEEESPRRLARQAGGYSQDWPYRAKHWQQAPLPDQQCPSRAPASWCVLPWEPPKHLGGYEVQRSCSRDTSPMFAPWLAKPPSNLTVLSHLHIFLSSISTPPSLSKHVCFCV